MAELRLLCAEIGWSNVLSYIQSGNLVFRADGKRSSLESELKQAIDRRFGLSIEVIVRTGGDWVEYVGSNPFLDASQREPNLVMLTLSKEGPRECAVEEIRGHAQSDERIQQIGDAIWIHYSHGVARSKLSPALLDRLVGSTVTARNWRTVLSIDRLLHDGE